MSGANVTRRLLCRWAYIFTKIAYVLLLAVAVSCGAIEKGDKKGFMDPEREESSLEPIALTDHPACYSETEIESQHCRMEVALLNLVNEDRARLNLQPLSLDPALSVQAKQWSCEMARTDNFTHEGSLLRIQNAGYESGAENIVQANYSESMATVKKMYALLYNSPRHNKNMMQKSYSLVGIGICRGAYGLFGTQLFVAQPK